MNEPLRVISWTADERARPDALLSHEWLVTNGLGGYASGTVAGVPTRRYHGLLVAAMPTPLGRVVMLNRLSERLKLIDGSAVKLGGIERQKGLKVHSAASLSEFRLEAGLPVWRFKIEKAWLEKRIVLVHGQNTTHITYELLDGADSARLKVSPEFNIRPHEHPVSAPLSPTYRLTMEGDGFEISSGSALPTLQMRLWGHPTAIALEPRVRREVYHRFEAGRGYADTGEFWSPGEFRLDLRPGRPVTLGASTEDWAAFRAVDPADALRSERARRARLIEAAAPEVRSGLGAELVLAADQFLIAPASRLQDEARGRAEGAEARTVIAGYHWFTDWGRDTMISLEGLTLATGRFAEAASILRTFSRHVRDGLIPNFFPDGANEGLYHTADATLWFFHALGRYADATGDRTILEQLTPILREIVERHRHGTKFGIGVDPRDGLLRQGEEGCQLTWMDAKVDGWVVTPRRGKAVEINALWYNALRLLESWMRELGAEDDAVSLGRDAERARESFNARFWNGTTGCLYDVVDGEDGDDPVCRPNQILAISLSHPVLDQSRWESTVEVVRCNLLTPLGLRSLGPDEPGYQARYDGNLRSRDAAYHQGTVWAWLIGPYIDAWLKVHPGDFEGVRSALARFQDHLGEAGMGSISEIFDAEPPFEPRGCIAQAWSVAEVLRCMALISRMTGGSASGGVPAISL